MGRRGHWPMLANQLCHPSFVFCLKNGDLFSLSCTVGIGQKASGSRANNEGIPGQVSFQTSQSEPHTAWGLPTWIYLYRHTLNS